MNHHKIKLLIIDEAHLLMNEKIFRKLQNDLKSAGASYIPNNIIDSVKKTKKFVLGPKRSRWQ